MKKMLPGNRRKASYTVGIIILVVCVYNGYIIGLMDSYNDLTVDRLSEKFIYFFLRPLPLLWDSHTSSGTAVGVIAALIIWVYYSSLINNRIVGREYGTAKFAEPKVITRKLSYKGVPSKILGKNLFLSTDDRRTGLNNNLLVIGGSGAGKSFRYVKPNILRCNGSMVVTDPKGELLRDTGEYLKSNGYNVKVLNLVDPRRSDKYNPFAYIRKMDDVVKLVSIIIKNTTPKGATQTDPFWEKAESLYLQSLIFYVWLAPEMDSKRNFESVISLMQEASVSEDENVKSDLDNRMKNLLKRDWEIVDHITGEILRFRGSEHPAYKTYMMVRAGAVDTVRSILISANARMGFLINSPDLLETLSEDEMNISDIGMDPNKKSAIFCVIPDSDTTYNAVAGMLYSQIFTELYFQADNHTESGKLHVPVSFWMDEFANIALPSDFTSLLSTMRSRGISCNVIIQNLAQIKERYEKSWETITGNCDTLVYLGGNEQSTHKYISEMLGKWTIEKRSTSTSTGRNGNTSRSDDVLGRDLMTPDEVRMLDNKREIVMIRGEYPVLCEKYKTEKDPRFIAASNMAKYRVPIRERRRPDLTKARANIEVMINNQPAYSAGARTIATSLAQLRKLDPVGKKELTIVNGGVAEQVDSKKEEEKETIRSRMKEYDFSDEQLDEAILASADGLSESQILEWFLPGNSPRKMELLRKMQLNNRKIR